LKRALASQGLDPHSFAAKSGIDVSLVQKIIAGEDTPDENFYKKADPVLGKATHVISIMTASFMKVTNPKPRL
jgi:predicted transcriptional regulator